MQIINTRDSIEIFIIQSFITWHILRYMPKEGNMTKGTDGNNIDGMSIERINTLIDRIKMRHINLIQLNEYI